MKLNINSLDIKSITYKGKVKDNSTIQKIKIKGIEFIPFKILDKFYGNINNTEYEIVIDDNYCPKYVISTILNDVYDVGTIKPLSKDNNYKNLSKYWTYLSTTIPIKGEIKNGKLYVLDNTLTSIYSKYYKKQVKDEYYKQSKK